jgi:hypothetical protein
MISPHTEQYEQVFDLWCWETFALEPVSRSKQGVVLGVSSTNRQQQNKCRNRDFAGGVLNARWGFVLLRGPVPSSVGMSSQERNKPFRPSRMSLIEHTLCGKEMEGMALVSSGLWNGS